MSHSGEYHANTLGSQGGIDNPTARASQYLQAGGEQPVAIMNRNQVVGYFVPVVAVEKIQFEATADIQATLARRRPFINATLKYLEDK